MDMGLIPVLQATSCEALGKETKLFQPQYLHLYLLSQAPCEGGGNLKRVQVSLGP